MASRSPQHPMSWGMMAQAREPSAGQRGGGEMWGCIRGAAPPALPLYPSRIKTHTEQCAPRKTTSRPLPRSFSLLGGVSPKAVRRISVSLCDGWWLQHCLKSQGAELRVVATAGVQGSGGKMTARSLAVPPPRPCNSPTQVLAGEPGAEEAGARAAGRHPHAEERTDGAAWAGHDALAELNPPGGPCAPGLGLTATLGRCPGPRLPAGL